jgi:multidrug efflux pump subunit AcrB
VGLITLIGLVSRNGTMMISHYLHLLKHKGETRPENAPTPERPAILS